MSTCRNVFVFFVVLLSTFMSVSSWANASLAEKVIIVVNTNDPDSLSIGQYYARSRGIPESNIVRIQAPTRETISIGEYSDTIANPLLNALLENEWVNGVKASSKDRYGRERLSVSVHRIPFVVMIRGVPLRIENDPSLIESGLDNMQSELKVNNASVDGEISLLLAPPNVSMTAFVPNPYFGRTAVSEIDANRILRVSRLDGPGKQDVINLIDHTLEAEEVGLMGRAYIDLGGGPNELGDEWIRSAGELVEAAHFDTDFHTDSRRMDYRERLDAPAIYVGWYRHSAYAQWSAPTWPVPAGAIAFHLHSYSGTSVRDPTKWLGAFISQGYCATMGNVYEPYLSGVHRPEILLKYLLDGGNFGEAVMMSTPALSWQSVAIGDPLYQPFKVSLEDQLEDSLDNRFAAYASVREANRLLDTQGADAAIAFARSRFLSQPSLALAFRLAQLYGQEGQDREAVEVLKIVRYLSAFPEDEFVLVQKIANFLHQRGESELAFGLYKILLDERHLDKQLKISLFEGGAVVADSLNEPVIASRWRLEARNLKSPPSPNPAAQ